MARALRPDRDNPAVRAEPAGIGTAGARDRLAREVKLLGALLGQVIVEQAGRDLLELVEQMRRTTIGRRREGGEAHRRRLTRQLDELDVEQAELLVRAFGLYFQLVNLAEEKQRVRRLRQRRRASPRGVIDESIASAMEAIGYGAGGRERAAALASRLSIGLVLTAHPTEARRRTILVALRRCYRLLDRLDDPRLTPTEDADIRRRLRQEITLLWHTSQLRREAPTPLDEVRAAMTFFDETLFVVTPRVYRTLDAALDDRRDQARAASAPARDTGSTGTRPSKVPAFLRWGSWIGGDRDGNPNVTASITRDAIRIQSEHVLHAYEAVLTRLIQTISVTLPLTRVRETLATRLEADARLLPATVAELRRRFPDEPYRQRLGVMVERLRRTRGLLVRGDESGREQAYGAADLLAEVDELCASLASAGLGRVAYGEVQDLRWQVETFGLHALDLEVRQHSEVHSAALAALGGGPGDSGNAASAAPPGGALEQEASAGVTVAEVLDTLRAITEIQQLYGERACHRYVVSFTRRAEDVTDVLSLARHAAAASGGPAPALDVVPLFESAGALEGCAAIMDQLLGDAAYRAHLTERRDHQDVMLGYSDSTKESGFLSASWMLYEAQERLVDVARRHGIAITLFHGRGGAIGRGGGPTNRAILGQAPGSVEGRLRFTEQGEVIAAHYANMAIAERQLEQVTHAVLIASTPEQARRAESAAVGGRGVLTQLAERSRAAYRELVWEEPLFETYFRGATPIGELSELTLGSRPAARARREPGRAPSLESLRAIPWVFAWTQSRTNLPGWYGLGSALAAYREEHGDAGLDELARLYREWPFLASVLDNAEMILAKADMGIAARYARLVPGREARGLWVRIRREFDTSVELLLRITGHATLLDGMPVLQRSIALRNPYVDSLSEIQVRALARLRALPADDPARAELLRLVHLTVSGVAAGLQNTG